MLGMRNACSKEGWIYLHKVSATGFSSIALSWFHINVFLKYANYKILFYWKCAIILMNS